MSQWRLACIALVDFVMKACSQEMDLSKSSVVVDRAGRKILALNQTASKCGIRVGDPLNLGWTRCPDLQVLDWSSESIDREMKRILSTLEMLSPSCQIVPGYLGYFMIDAGGMSLLGGEEGLIYRIRKTCTSIGYVEHRIGLASQWGVAFLAAHTAGAQTPVCSISETEQIEFIDQTLLQNMNCSPTVEQGLKLLGVERLGQLKALPRRAMRDRFGDALESIFTLIDTLDFRTPHMVNNPEYPRVEWSLEQPVLVAGHLLLGLRHLCISLCTQLLRIAYQTTTLLLELVLDDGATITEKICVSQPVSNAEVLFELVRVHVESDRVAHLSAPITQILITAVSLTPLEGEQVCFGTGRWQKAKAQAVMNRLHAHAGHPVVYKASPTFSPMHDEAYQWIPLSISDDVKSPKYEPLQQPKLMCRRLPTPIEVQVQCTATQGEHRIRLNGSWACAVVVSRERRSGGWWAPSPYTFEDFCFDVSSHGVCWVRYLKSECKWMLMGGWD